MDNSESNGNCNATIIRYGDAAGALNMFGLWEVSKWEFFAALASGELKEIRKYKKISDNTSSEK